MTSIGKGCCRYDMTESLSSGFSKRNRAPDMGILTHSYLGPVDFIHKPFSPSSPFPTELFLCVSVMDQNQ